LVKLRSLRKGGQGFQALSASARAPVSGARAFLHFVRLRCGTCKRGGISLLQRSDNKGKAFLARGRRSPYPRALGRQALL